MLHLNWRSCIFFLYFHTWFKETNPKSSHVTAIGSIQYFALWFFALVLTNGCIKIRQRSIRTKFSCRASKFKIYSTWEQWSISGRSKPLANIFSNLFHMAIVTHTYFSISGAYIKHYADRCRFHYDILARHSFKTLLSSLIIYLQRVQDFSRSSRSNFSRGYISPFRPQQYLNDPYDLEIC